MSSVGARHVPVISNRCHHIMNHAQGSATRSRPSVDSVASFSALAQGGADKQARLEAVTREQQELDEVDVSRLTLSVAGLLCLPHASCVVQICPQNSQGGGNHSSCRRRVPATIPPRMPIQRLAVLMNTIMAFPVERRSRHHRYEIQQRAGTAHVVGLSCRPTCWPVRSNARRVPLVVRGFLRSTPVCAGRHDHLCVAINTSSAVSVVPAPTCSATV